MSRSTVETDAYMAFLRRVIAAGGRRAGNEDEIQLGMLIRLLEFLEDVIAKAVARQRERGISWDRIALATGTTRQAAQKRWGRR